MQLAYKIPGSTGDWIVLANASVGAFIKVFLGSCKVIGMILPQFIRANGEVF